MSHLKAMLALKVGGTTPVVPDTGWPDALDATITALRPIPTYQALTTLTVDPALPEVGVNFHTITAAMDKAGDIQDAAIQQTSLAPGEFSLYGDARGPEYRVDILVQPGDYEEAVGGKGWVALVGMGAKGDVVIHSATTGGGTFHAFGPIYIENITFVSDDPGTGGMVDTGQKYPMHITVNGPGAFIAANCDFIVENESGQWAVGMDAGPYVTTLFYKCGLTGLVDGTQCANLHSAEDVQGVITTMFVECTLSGDVVYSNLSDLSTDRTWDYNNTGGAVLTEGTVTEHTSSDWPVPDRTLSDAAETYYLPVKTVPSTQTYGVSGVAPFSPPDGRTYYVRVKTPAAIHRTHHGIVADDDGGVVGIRSGRNSNPPEHQGTQSLGTVHDGINDIAFYYFDTFYPGDEIFIQVDIVSGGPLLMGSLDWSDGSYYSDDDGATKSHCDPDNDPVPVIRLRSAS